MPFRILISVIIWFSVAFASQGQSLNKYKRIVGVWTYVNHSGFEIWQQKDGAILGETYRIQNGTDTVKIETMRIVKEGKTTVLYFKSINSTNASEIRFVESPKHRFKFVNDKHDFPKSIYYKFRFLSKRKARVILNHPHEDNHSKPMEMVKKKA
jgi:hypothetical protein